MAKLVAARAWCNNEVAYLVWKSDGKIDGCLGFERADQLDGHVHLALYELDDPELIELLVTHQKRLDLILCTAGSKKPPKGSGTPVEWDTTTRPVRDTLQKLMGTRLQNRMFNNSAHMEHNKFAVLLDRGGKPTTCGRAVRTGLGPACARRRTTPSSSTPTRWWPPISTTGSALHADKLPTPKPLTAPLASNQGAALRAANVHSKTAALNGDQTQVELWYSPNTPEVGTPQTRTVPPDLAVVFELMKQAKDAVFFLVFNPGRSDPAGDDVNTVVAAGIEFGRLDPKLTVMGAISDPTAVPGYVASPPGQKQDKSPPTLEVSGRAVGR